MPILSRIVVLGLTSIAVSLLFLSDILLNLEIRENSVTAYLSVIALALVATGLLTHLTAQFRLRTKRHRGPLLAHSRFSNILLWVSFWTALAFGAFQWLGGVDYLQNPVALQRLVIHALLIAVILYFSLTGDPNNISIRAISVAGVAGAIAIILDAIFTLELLGSRHASMFLLIPLTLIIASYRNKLLQIIAVIVVLAGIFSSASRSTTAVAIALILLGGVILVDRSLGQRITLVATGALSFLGFLVANTRFQERFLQPGDQAVVVNLRGMSDEGIVINTNGRAEVWRALVESAFQGSPLFGNGVGFAFSYVNEEFGWAHPHNEYIRIFADHGALGLVLFCASMFSLASFFGRHSEGSPGNRFIGLGSILSLALMSLTDLPLVALGTVLPAAIAIGQSINNLRSPETGATKDNSK